MSLIATDKPQIELVQKGNAKLQAANMLMFNLPATKEVCGRACEGCYAIKEQRIYPGALLAREQRFTASKSPDFVVRIHKELAKRKKRPKYFRVHASGEFYSQDYVDAWAEIARQNSDVIFYAYSKRMKTFDFSNIDALPNFVIIDSLFFTGLNYGPKDQAPPGAFLCPDQKGANVSCGVDCTWCQTKGCADKKGVWFVKH
jgi:hypothetical protein